MLPLIIFINKSIVIFPFIFTCIVRRVDVDAVHLFRIQVFQQLQGMVVISLDQRMPQIAVRRIAHGVQLFEIGINRFAKLGYRYQAIQRLIHRLPLRQGKAMGHFAINRQHLAHIAATQRNSASCFYRHIIEHRGFRNMIFKNQAKFLLLVLLFQRLPNLPPQGFIRNAVNQCIKRICHKHRLLYNSQNLSF